MKIVYKALGTIFVLLLIACPMTFGETIKLVSTGGVVSHGVYIYPYNISINNSPTTIPVWCIDFTHDIYLGQSWQGTIFSGDNNSLFEQIAWIISQSGKTTEIIQWALWYLDSPSAVGSWLGTGSNLYAAAKSLAESSLGKTFDGKITIYQPQSPPWPGGGAPGQRFLSLSNDPVPEPSTALLLSIGLFAVVGAARRRSKK